MPHDDDDEAPRRPGAVPKSVGAYPSARRAGPLLFLSGMGPRHPDTDEVPGQRLNAHGQHEAFDFEAQARQVFANVRAALEANGARWEQLVDVTVFLTDIERDFVTFNRLYAEAFGEVRPARTTVGIDSLPRPICVELKCVAYLGEPSGGR